MKNQYKYASAAGIFKIKAVMLFLFLLQSSGFIFAQNISNPSFEILTTAGTYPTSVSQMNRAASWIQPTDGTCDYFYGPPNPADYRINANSNTISAQDGAAYIGGFMELSNVNKNYKEYITNRLSAKLTAGVTYSISFYTMHLFVASTTPGFGSMQFTDLPASEKGFIGLCFSAAAPTGADTNPVGASSNDGGIYNSWNSTRRTLIPASNTAVYGAGSRNTWVPVTLLYTADGTEEYMTIGQWRQASTSLPVNNVVYYLFDNFSPTINPVANLSKGVSPSSIADGGTATYTFTVSNTQSGSAALSGISFTDSLPSGLRIANTPNVVVTGLTGGSTTAVAGGTSIAASGYSIAANTTATITVNVTNAAGQLNASCGSNPAAFTNSAANISNLSSNLNNTVGNVCLVVTPCSTPPAFTTNLTPGSESVCQNATATTLSVAATDVTYQWYSNTSNSTVGGTPISGATNSSYTPSTSAPGTLYYYVVIAKNTQLGCTFTSNIRSVTVNANPTFTTNQTTGTQTVCENIKPAILAVAANNVTYQWYTNTTNSNIGGTPISGQTSSTYDPPVSGPLGTTYYYAVITSTTTGCTAASNVRGITRNPATTITTQPDSTPQNLCQNGTGATLTVAATGTGTITYQWWYSTAATGGALTNIGVTGQSASYTIPTTSAFATRYYYVVVSSTCGTATSSPRTPVTVNANPTFTTNQTTGTQTVCQNNAATALSVVASNVTFQWYSNTTNSNIGGTLISGATSNTYTPSTATPGTTYYYVVITSTTTGCSTASNVRGVTVNQLISSQPNSTPQDLCVGGTATALTVSATGATNYQWYYSDAPTGGASVLVSSGAAATSYTPPTTTAFATRYYYVNVTGSCGTVSSSPRTPVTVYAYPTAVSVTPATQTVAFNGTPVNLTVTAMGATSYQWYSNATNSNTGGTLISGANTSSYTPPTTVAGTQYYYVVAANAGSCNTSSSAVQVIVNACPVGGSTPAVNSSVGNNCPTATVNLNTQAHIGTVPANSTLVWFTNNTHTGPAYATPTAATAGTYYAFYYSSASSCYSPASSAVVVTITTCSPCNVADPVSINLNLWISAGTAPAGSVKQWHTSVTPSASTLISTGIVQATSTPTSYWVFYYDSVNNCYSPGSRIVVVGNACCNYPTVDLTALSQTTAPAGSQLVWYTTNNHVNNTKVSDPTDVGLGLYFPFFYDAVNDCYSPVGTPVLVGIDDQCTTACYKPGLNTGGAILDTKLGISALGRAGADDRDNWPMIRKGGHIALESKTKAFVPNRVAFSDADSNPATLPTPVGIDADNFVEGMMVYDTTNKCLKIYTLKEGDSTMAWHCVTTQACPD